jgi:Uma2 family endonuclease
MQAHDALSHASPRLMSRAEYEQLAEQGFFSKERVELIRGIVVKMSPIGSRHSDPIDVLTEHFVLGLKGRAKVRIQQPFAASDDSEPEPDVLLAPPKRYADAHPSQAFLIVEVAESSLAYDRETKAPLYASSGVPEYWNVDVNERRIEVHASPAGGRYERVRFVGSEAALSPAAFPDVVLAVGDLFAY